MIVMFTLTQDMLASLRERATTDTRLLRAAFEGDACAFTFIHASKLRDASEADLACLPSLAELRSSRPDWLVSFVLNLEDGCRSACVFQPRPYGSWFSPA